MGIELLAVWITPESFSNVSALPDISRTTARRARDIFSGSKF
jgi:hypothetical protein